MFVFVTWFLFFCLFLIQFECFYRICFIILMLYTEIYTEDPEGEAEQMATLGKSQDGEKEYFTVPEAVVKDKRKGKMRSLDLCVILDNFFVT